MPKSTLLITLFLSIGISFAGCTGGFDPLLKDYPVVTPLPDRFVAVEPHRWIENGSSLRHVVSRRGEVYRGTGPDGSVVEFTLYDLDLPHDLLVVQAKIESGRLFYGFVVLKDDDTIHFHGIRTYQNRERLFEAGADMDYRSSHYALFSTDDLLLAIEYGVEAFEPDKPRSIVQVNPSGGTGTAAVAGTPAPSDGADASATEIIALLQAGNRIAVTPRTTLIMGGFVDRLTSSCGSLGLSSGDGTVLAGFAATAAFQATFGGNYRDIDIGQSLSATALYGGAGDLAHRAVGCGPDAQRLLREVAESVRSGGDEHSLFVTTCQEHLGQQRCSCLQREARSVMGNLANREYSRDIMPSIVQANPFAAIRIGMTCGISNY